MFFSIISHYEYGSEIGQGNNCNLTISIKGYYWASQKTTEILINVWLKI